MSEHDDHDLFAESDGYDDELVKASQEAELPHLKENEITECTESGGK